jgi:DNA-binding HxlR family transcriptional regulator
MATSTSPCRARTILERIGDKWAIYIVSGLGDGPRRFTELNRSIDGITARMLTVTLRGLERDGIVTRTVHASVPPRVDYELTSLGRTLLVTLGQLVTWAEEHTTEVEAARADYDARSCPPPCEQEASLPARGGYGVRLAGRPGWPASQAAPLAYRAVTSGPRSPGMSFFTG